MTYERVTLRDVVEPRPGTRNPSANGALAFSYVDLDAVDREMKAITAPKRLAANEAPSRARKIIRARDVLVALVRPNLNAIALVPPDLDNAIASTGFCVLRATDLVLPEYLFYFARSQRFVASLCGLVSGAMYPAVTEGQVLNQKVTLPPIAEQRRIVELLSRAEYIVRMRREAEAKAKEIIPALFSIVFPTRSGSPTVPLVGLVDQSRGITYGVVQRGEDTPGGIPLLRIGDFVGNEWAPRDVVRVEPALSQQYSRTILQGGEIVVSIRGTIGRTAIVPADAQGWNVAREVAVVPLLPGVSREFVHAFLLSPEAQQFFSRETRGVAQRGINLEDLRTLPLPTPSSEDVGEYEAYIAPMRSAVGMQARAISVAQLTFDSLLAGVFGEDVRA